MTKLKNRLDILFSGLGLAFFSLIVLSTQTGTFGISSILYEFLHIQIPDWLAWVLLGVGGAAAVVACCASFGIAVPAVVAELVSCAGNTAA